MSPTWRSATTAEPASCARTAKMSVVFCHSWNLLCPRHVQTTEVGGTTSATKSSALSSPNPKVSSPPRSGEPLTSGVHQEARPSRMVSAAKTRSTGAEIAISAAYPVQQEIVWSLLLLCDRSDVSIRRMYANRVDAPWLCALIVL